MPEIFGKQDLKDELGSGLNPGNILTILLQGQKFMQNLDDVEWEEQKKRWKLEDEAWKETTRGWDKETYDKNKVKWDNYLEDRDYIIKERILKDKQAREDRNWLDITRSQIMIDNMHKQEDRVYTIDQREQHAVKTVTDTLKRQLDDFQTRTQNVKGDQFALGELVEDWKPFFTKFYEKMYLTGNKEALQYLNSTNAMVQDAIGDLAVSDMWNDYLTNIRTLHLDSPEAYTPSALASRGFDNVGEAVDATLNETYQMKEILSNKGQWSDYQENIMNQLETDLKSIEGISGSDGVISDREKNFYRMRDQGLLTGTPQNLIDNLESTVDSLNTKLETQNSSLNTAMKEAQAYRAQLNGPVPLDTGERYTKERLDVLDENVARIQDAIKDTEEDLTNGIFELAEWNKAGHRGKTNKLWVGKEDFNFRDDPQDPPPDPFDKDFKGVKWIDSSVTPGEKISLVAIDPSKQQSVITLSRKHANERRQLKKLEEESKPFIEAKEKVKLHEEIITAKEDEKSAIYFDKSQNKKAELSPQQKKDLKRLSDEIAQEKEAIEKIKSNPHFRKRIKVIGGGSGSIPKLKEYTLQKIKKVTDSKTRIKTIENQIKILTSKQP